MTAAEKSGKTFQLIAGVLGLLGFSVIITECINSFELFDFPVKIPFVAIPVLLLFLLSQIVNRIANSKANCTAAGKSKYHRIITVYNSLLFLMFIALAASIPFLWWGVIEKLSGMANQGKITY